MTILNIPVASNDVFLWLCWSIAWVCGLYAFPVPKSINPWRAIFFTTIAILAFWIASVLVI